MANRQSAGTGNWNTGGTWVGGIVPQAGDTVEILNGHTVTVDGEINAISVTTIRSGGVLKPGFQMSASTFVDINIDVGGQIYASRTASSLLRVTGVITLAAGAWSSPAINYGTLADPISNLAVGAFVEFVCVSDNQVSRGIVDSSNSSGNVIVFYGAARIRKTTLAQVANVNDLTIVVTDDLGFRSGTLAQAKNGLADFILITDSANNTAFTFSGANQIDIYLVSGYNPGTKTITLGDPGAGSVIDEYWERGGTTPNWNSIDTQRSVGTDVYLITNNVGMRGSNYNQRPAFGYKSGPTNVACTILFYNASFWWLYSAVYDSKSLSIYDGMTSIGCYTGIDLTEPNVSILNSIGAAGHHFMTNVYQSFVTNCYVLGGFEGISDSQSSYILNTVTNGCGEGLHSNNESCYFENCVFRNCPYVFVSASNFNIFQGCIIRNCLYGSFFGRGKFIDCTFQYMAGGVFEGEIVAIRTNFDNTYNALSSNGGHSEFTDCTFTNQPFALDWISFSKVSSFYSGFDTIVSRNHQGVVGDIYACSQGGYIVTDGSMPISGIAKSLKFSPVSSTLFCWIEERVYCQANSWVYIDVWMRKDTLGFLSEPAAQIVLPENDPFMNGSAYSQVQMTDVKDTWQHFSLSYKPTYSREIIVRMLAKNASGNAWFGVSVRAQGVILGN